MRKFPDRILAIYIRDVNIADRAKAVTTIADELKQQGEVEMVLVKETTAAAEHAANCGFIFTEEVQEVSREAELDKKGDE